MGNPEPPKVVVIGGSIAGLSTGIALRCLGCRVDVYEQSPTILRGRGGGLVVQYEMLEMLGQGHSVTGSLRSAGGRMRTHNAGAIPQDCDPAAVHRWHSQFVDHLNKRLGREWSSTRGSRFRFVRRASPLAGRAAGCRRSADRSWVASRAQLRTRPMTANLFMASPVERAYLGRGQNSPPKQLVEA